jgi:predicted transcriptional regulator
MELMTVNSIRHLPVIEKDQLIGVVSVGDMVKEILKHKVDTIKFLSRYIKEWDSSHAPIARL